MSAVVAGISVDEAERITEQIVGRIDSISENFDVVMGLMREALARKAHEALGYVSPGAYISDRFGTALSGLSASLRREFAHELSEAGMSNRAIAPVFGITEGTVRNDLKAGAQNYAPDPGVKSFTPPVASQDSEPSVEDAYNDPRWDVAFKTNPSTGEVVETVVPSVTEHTVTEKVKTVTGLDGKTYPRPEPKPDRRRSLVDAAYTANTNLWKAIEAIRTISKDDRYTRNKADILAALQPSADLAIEIITDLFNTRNENN